MDWVCFGEVSTVLTQALVYGVTFHTTSMPEDFSVWGLGSFKPCHHPKHAPEGPQVALPKDQSGKWLATLSMPSRRLMAVILGHWVSWANHDHHQGENSIDSSTRALNVWSGRNSRGHVGPFYVCGAFNQLLDWPIWWWWWDGWFSP